MPQTETKKLNSLRSDWTTNSSMIPTLKVLPINQSAIQIEMMHRWEASRAYFFFAAPRLAGNS